MNRPKHDEDGSELMDLVRLAKKKIKDKTVGTLGHVSSTNAETQSGAAEHDADSCTFFIDTTSQLPNWSGTTCDLSTEENSKDDDQIEDRSPILKFTESAEQLELASRLDPGLRSDDIYIRFADSNGAIAKQPQHHEKVLEKSVITSDFEKRHSLPSYQVAKRQMKKQRKKEKESSSGSGWFDMKAAEMTDELRQDLKLIQMRSILDPKRFYKNNDMKNIPKFVQIGKVVDSHADFYNYRVPKKQRKNTIVDELLADADLRKQNKRKYLDLQQKKMNRFSKGKKGKKREKS